MLPVLMLILSYQIILKSKFSTQSCVHCAFLFNVDNNCIYKHWLIWTQWWQAWNWFPLCNSSDQINQFALHCWFDLRWSSDCQGQCHHCIGSMFDDLSILTPLFIYDYQSDLSFTLAGISSLPIIKSLFLCLLCISELYYFCISASSLFFFFNYTQAHNSVSTELPEVCVSWVWSPLWHWLTRILGVRTNQPTANTFNRSNHHLIIFQQLHPAAKHFGISSL